MIKNKKGMVQALTGLAFGVVAFILIVTIGLVVLGKFSVSVVECPTGFTQTEGTTLCANATASIQASNSAYNSTIYGVSQLGSSGLLGWLPAVIALAVGLLFLIAFMGKNRAY
jgi:hypothetical protein